MCFVFWHYLSWQLFGLLFKKLGNFFPKSSGHPVCVKASLLVTNDIKATSIPVKICPFALHYKFVIL